MDRYIWSMDLSLSNSGFCIFDLKGNPVLVFSVPTDSKMNHGLRLKTIYDSVMEKREKFIPEIAVFEAGFYRFAASTQALYKIMGVMNLVFSDCEQKTYPPSSVKKIITGNGKSDKDQVRMVIQKRFPDLLITNNDQSDAIAVGMCYLIESRILERTWVGKHSKQK